jgi:hypothetical protein
MEECACRKPCSGQAGINNAGKPLVRIVLAIDGFTVDVDARRQPQLQLLHQSATAAADVTSNCQLLGCLSCRGEVADAVVMDKKNYGFVTFADPKIAMKFLEVCCQGAATAAAAAAARESRSSHWQRIVCRLACLLRSPAHISSECSSRPAGGSSSSGVWRCNRKLQLQHIYCHTSW